MLPEAVVDTPLQGGGGERSIELWMWELPSRRLVRRELADGRWAPDGRVVAVDLATRAAIANLTVRVSA
jgi:hypothetical protein